MTAAASMTVFLTVLALLAFRMASGDDPALRTGSASERVEVTAPATQGQPSTEVQPEGYDDPYGQSQNQQQQAQPPMQSGTS